MGRPWPRPRHSAREPRTAPGGSAGVGGGVRTHCIMCRPLTRQNNSNNGALARLRVPAAWACCCACRPPPPSPSPTGGLPVHRSFMTAQICRAACCPSLRGCAVCASCGSQTATCSHRPMPTALPTWPACRSSACRATRHWPRTAWRRFVADFGAPDIKAPRRVADRYWRWGCYPHVPIRGARMAVTRLWSSPPDRPPEAAAHA